VRIYILEALITCNSLKILDVSRRVTTTCLSTSSRFSQVKFSLLLVEIKPAKVFVITSVYYTLFENNPSRTVSDLVGHHLRIAPVDFRNTADRGSGLQQRNSRDMSRACESSQP